MRKKDKLKNILKANILTEQRYLNNKSPLINENNALGEYDYGKLDRDYSGMGQDRKDKLTNWGKERQIGNGIIVKSRDNDSELSIMPNDIVFYNYPIYKEYQKKMEAYSRQNEPNDYPFSTFLKSNQMLHYFDLSAKNSVFINIDNNPTTDIKIHVTGELKPMNDKDFPPLSFDIKHINLSNDNGDRKLLPIDRKGTNILTKKIKEVLINKFGKYSMPGRNEGDIFIKEINVHPNVFLS